MFSIARAGIVNCFPFVVAFIAAFSLSAVAAEQSSSASPGSACDAAPASGVIIRGATRLVCKPYHEVAVEVLSPDVTLVNKPFVVVYNFRQPVSGFSTEQIKVSNGSVMYLAGNSYSTVFRVLVLPDEGVDKAENPEVVVNMYGTSTSDVLSTAVKVNPAAVELIASSDVVDESVPEHESYLYTNLVVSRGGDAIDAEGSHNVSDTLGIQFGISLAAISTILGPKIVIPHGSLRLLLGYDEMNSGSKSDNTENTFSVTSMDILYDFHLSLDMLVVAGMTIAYQPKLQSQNLRFRNLDDPYEGTVKFKTAYGLKILMEYILVDADAFDIYGNFGYTSIDYESESIEVAGSEESINSPTNVDGSSLKLALGMRF